VAYKSKFRKNSNKNEPVYKHTKEWDCNGGWPKRDEIPTSDPIGDVDESSNRDKETAHTNGYVDGYKAWKADMDKYVDTVKDRLLHPKGKLIDAPEYGVDVVKKCDCGTEKTYGKVPLNSHSRWCKLRQ